VALFLQFLLQLRQNSVRAGNLFEVSIVSKIICTRLSYSHLPWVGFAFSVLYDSVLVDDHCPATIPISHTSGPSMILREERLCIAEEELCDVVSVYFTLLRSMHIQCHRQ